MTHLFFHSRRQTLQAFTLIELLLSIGILSIVLVTTTSLLNTSLNQLRVSEAGFGQFQESQAAFETMTSRLSSCELNPYYDYQYPGNNLATVPTGYKLESDLHFVSGRASGGTNSLLQGSNYPSHAVFFHGTFGLTEQTPWKGLGTLLNSWGYFIEFGDDSTERATFLNGGATPPRYRFRLKELQVPSEALQTYAVGLSTLPSPTVANLYQWFRIPAADSATTHTLAENIIAMVITPLMTNAAGNLSNELAPAYTYDSRTYQYASTGLAERTRHKLPPLLRITLVALDEVSAQQLQDDNGSSMPDLGIGGLFSNPSQYESDLATLESALVGQKLRYRVFSTMIRLRNARWTNQY